MKLATQAGRTRKQAFEEVEPIKSVNRLLGAARLPLGRQRADILREQHAEFCKALAAIIYREQKRIALFTFRGERANHVCQLHEANKNAAVDFRIWYSHVQKWFQHPINLSSRSNGAHLIYGPTSEEFPATDVWKDAWDEPLSLPEVDAILTRNPVKPKRFAATRPELLLPEVVQYWKDVSKRTADAIFSMLVYAHHQRRVGLWTLDHELATASFTWYSSRVSDTRPVPVEFAVTPEETSEFVEISGARVIEDISHFHALKNAQLVPLDAVHTHPSLVVPDSIAEWLEQAPGFVQSFINVLVGDSLVELSVSHQTDQQQFSAKSVAPRPVHPLTDPTQPYIGRPSEPAPDPEFFLNRIARRHLDPCVCFGPFALSGWGTRDVASELQRRGRSRDRKQRAKEINEQLMLNQQNLRSELDERSEQLRFLVAPTALSAMLPLLMFLLRQIFAADAILGGFLNILFWMASVVCPLFLMGYLVLWCQDYAWLADRVRRTHKRRERLLDEKSLLSAQPKHNDELTF